MVLNNGLCAAVKLGITELYEGKQEGILPQPTTLGASVVLREVSLVDNPQNHAFYFYNFFTTHELMKSLTEKDEGTSQLRRMNNCPVKDDKVMAKQKRATYDYSCLLYTSICGCYRLPKKNYP